MQNLCCAVTTHSHLASCKKKKHVRSLRNAVFQYYRSLASKSATKISLNWKTNSLLMIFFLNLQNDIFEVRLVQMQTWRVQKSTDMLRFAVSAMAVK